ncbi:MAG: DUF4402 domain-containing protein, partial [Caulobacterales bacterium]|nr:DUF4402 domain-containing protein [Caulobacterales bacterium]
RVLGVDDSPGYVRVEPSGAITNSANIIRLLNGRPAEFLVEGALPGQTLQVDVVATEYLAGPSQSLTKPTVTNIEVEPVSPVTDGIGRARFWIGARLNTVGKTPIGMNEDYAGTLTVTVTPL